MQIDESKIGNRKYHRGHVVEGQWVFGGIARFPEMLHCYSGGQNRGYTHKPYPGVGGTRNDNCQ